MHSLNFTSTLYITTVLNGSDYFSMKWFFFQFYICTCVINILHPSRSFEEWYRGACDGWPCSHSVWLVVSIRTSRPVEQSKRTHSSWWNEVHLHQRKRPRHSKRDQSWRGLLQLSQQQLILPHNLPDSPPGWVIYYTKVFIQETSKVKQSPNSPRFSECFI